MRALQTALMRSATSHDMKRVRAGSARGSVRSASLIKHASRAALARAWPGGSAGSSPASPAGLYCRPGLEGLRMTGTARHDAWSVGDSYDRYMGRWSRRIAPRFLDWFDAPPDRDWLEVGCGTGALSAAILERSSPRSFLAVDQSAGFVDTARANVTDRRLEFRVGDAQALPFEGGRFDVIASGLVVNFIPDRIKALSEMRRVARPGALIGFYVWDYPGGGIEFMRAFWNAATELDPSVVDLSEGRRFPFCTPEGLTTLVHDAGLNVVDHTAVAASTVFRDFGDYWQPFTLGAGPAPGYCSSLDPEHRERLRRRLAETLPRQEDGSIRLKARAWAVKARAD